MLTGLRGEVAMKLRILVIAAALLFVLALQVGSTAAAIGMSGESVSETLRGKVRVHLEGTLEAEEEGTVGRGRFTLSGVLSDSGRFVDYVGISGGGLSIRRILFGSKGTIRVRVTVSPDPFEPTTWKIIKGTKAYAGLRGQGGETGGAEGGSINVTMRGTVSQ
jgi:hypothetical protein